MCYTIEINLTREQLEKRFNAVLNEHLPYRKQLRLSAFTLPDCPVICTGNPDNIQLFTWGLIPYWARDEKYAGEIRMKTFNAKAETLTQKASYRNLIESSRCLVPVNGFYEWQARGREKQPYFICLRDTEAFSLAGLFDTWTNRTTGEILNTFTIITTSANPMMEKIHNTKKRMPVIVERENENKWIDPLLPPEKALEFLKPFDEVKMTAQEVDSALFKRNLPQQEEE